jgi:Uma2 family endonuclease
MNLPDDGNRYESMQGELIMTPAPIPTHQRISRIIVVQLNLFIEKHHSGEIFFSSCDVRLTKADLVQPDIFFIAKENRKIIVEKYIQGAPDLIIEILSPNTLL